MSHPKKEVPVQRCFAPATPLILSTLLSLGCLTVANAQTAKTLPSDVIAANQELDHQLLEAHRLLDVNVWTDFRRQENGRWVYLFRHAHLVTAERP
ncbi:MAG: hypothetical protein ACJ8DC_17480 [Gemmatimonadales bacterium]